jgi:hypothetical protein
MNPTRLTVQHDLKWSDGSALAAGDFGGLTLYIDDLPAVSIPLGYEADGEWEMPLKDFAAATVIGTHTLRVSLAAKRAGGEIVESDPSEPVAYTYADERVPTRPFGVRLS